MLINQRRVMNVSQTRAALKTVLDDAHQGCTTHISRDGEIAAHIVPPNALVHRGREFAIMMNATINAAAQWITNDAAATGFSQAGEPIGRVFGWLWRSDRHKTMKWLAVYAEAVAQAFDNHGYATPTFAPLWHAFKEALKASLTDEEILEFEAFTRDSLKSQPRTPFTPDELAGRDRPRCDDDPWPDAASTGKSWVKKRYRHLVIGDFIPNPDFAHQLNIGNEHWCRVNELTPSNAVLQRFDGTATTIVFADAGSHWVPFQGHQPYNWPTSR